ncbi:unnamed protein product [Pieris macdunnoughi]|uniref:RNase H type-1 domain-containing protein n=1 Tax=Pieris macdunnoughi TaxID=345717 RepID=A0A821TMD5_9NEOP|nr:unnamed protein product [Pieris macdunnoughi]
MVVTRKRKYDNPRLTMNKEPIIFTNKIRILGVEIDAALTFKGHIDNLYNGSKTSVGVGAAWTEWQDGTEIKNKKVRLAPYCTVYQAELAALRDAVTYLTKRRRNAAVLSDSRSSLDAIAGGRSLDPQVAEIRQNLEECHENGIKIELFWVKAHVGTTGNEMADALAGEAVRETGTRIGYVAYPLSYLRRLTRLKTLDTWNERYVGGETASVTKMFFKDANAAYKQIKTRRFAPDMAQILTGHGAFGHYLHRLKLKTSPACDCDDRTDQTVVHLLVDCANFGRARCDLELETGMRVSRDGLSDMLLEHRSQLEKFCDKIVRYVTHKNSTRDNAGVAGQWAPTHL